MKKKSNQYLVNYLRDDKILDRVRITHTGRITTLEHELGSKEDLYLNLINIAAQTFISKQKIEFCENDKITLIDLENKKHHFILTSELIANFKQAHRLSIVGGEHGTGVASALLYDKDPIPYKLLEEFHKLIPSAKLFMLINSYTFEKAQEVLKYYDSQLIKDKWTEDNHIEYHDFCDSLEKYKDYFASENRDDVEIKENFTYILLFNMWMKYYNNKEAMFTHTKKKIMLSIYDMVGNLIDSGFCDYLDNFEEFKKDYLAFKDKIDKHYTPVRVK